MRAARAQLLAIVVALAAPVLLPAAAAGANGVNLDSPVARIRVDLDRLLAEHAFLTIEEMRSGLTGGSDFQAAAGAVEANTTELSAAFGSIYGQQAADRFGQIWRSHIGYVVDYAVSLGKHDTPGRQAALDGLASYRKQLEAFLTGANPGISMAGIHEALQMHDAQLVGFVDAVAAGDHKRAYDIEREAYPHMFEIGDVLARVVAQRFPDRFTGLDVAYSAAGTLRVTLDRVLAEHAFLAAEAMRAGLAGQVYFDASKQALDENSADLQALIGAAFGDPPAKSFRTLWNAHNSAYIAYIDAVNAGDAAAKTKALDDLNTDAGQLSGFLAAALPQVDAAALTDMFKMHIGHLTGQVDAFASGDMPKTYELVRAGYRHMFDVGEALANAIASQLPAKFPALANAPQTSTAIDDPASWAMPIVLLVSVIVGAVIGVGLGLPSLRRARSRS